jgi:hypothetical protein
MTQLHTFLLLQEAENFFVVLQFGKVEQEDMHCERLRGIHS